MRGRPMVKGVAMVVWRDDSTGVFSLSPCKPRWSVGVTGYSRVAGNASVGLYQSVRGLERAFLGIRGEIVVFLGAVHRDMTMDYIDQVLKGERMACLR